VSVDPVEAVRFVLRADAALAKRVATRIMGGELPEADTKNMPRACIVLKPAGGPGGPGGGYQDYGKTRIDVICYGESIHESWLVYLAAYDVLKAIRRVKSAGVLVHSAEVSSKGSTARDPVKQWPVTYSSWLVLHSEVAAA
jgi:hypothetical protein